MKTRRQVPNLHPDLGATIDEAWQRHSSASRQPVDDLETVVATRFRIITKEEYSENEPDKTMADPSFYEQINIPDIQNSFINRPPIINADYLHKPYYFSNIDTRYWKEPFEERQEKIGINIGGLALKVIMKDLSQLEIIPPIKVGSLPLKLPTRLS
jgi:hypothetical protein